MTSIAPLTREAALAHWQAQGLPTAQSDHWRYTRVPANFIEQALAAPVYTVSDAIDVTPYLTAYALADCYALVIYNGVLLAQAGLQALLSTEKVQLNPVQANLELHAYPALSPFDHLNAAHYQTGFDLRVDENARLSKPIQFIDVNTAQATTAFHIRNKIELGANSQVNIINTRTPRVAAQFENELTMLTVGQGAQCGLYHVSAADDHRCLVENYAIEMGQDARLTTFNFAQGGKMHRQALHVNLAQAGSEVNLQGVLALQGSRHFDQNITVSHAGKHTKSYQTYRGLIADQASGVFNGKVFVAEGAKDTIAHQETKNLLLSNGANMYMRPQLEINTDDIQCSHGAAVGQLDEQVLFYLTSRGIDAALAKSVLSMSFVQSQLNTLTCVPFKQVCQATLFALLPGGEALREWVA